MLRRGAWRSPRVAGGPAAIAEILDALSDRLAPSIFTGVTGRADIAEGRFDAGLEIIGRTGIDHRRLAPHDHNGFAPHDPLRRGYLGVLRRRCLRLRSQRGLNARDEGEPGGSDDNHAN